MTATFHSTFRKGNNMNTHATTEEIRASIYKAMVKASITHNIYAQIIIAMMDAVDEGIDDAEAKAKKLKEVINV